jgi:hypothetical protein
MFFSLVPLFPSLKVLMILELLQVLSTLLDLENRFKIIVAFQALQRTITPNKNLLFYSLPSSSCVVDEAMVFLWEVPQLMVFVESKVDGFSLLI